MPRRFFKKFAFKRETLARQWYLRPVRGLFRDSRLWAINRRNVVPAFAAGLFIAFMPVPGHVLIAVLFAFSVRISIAVTAATTFVCNPLTIGPMYYLAYRLGLMLLGMEPETFYIELSIEWLSSELSRIWRPLLLGTTLLGMLAALLGYLLLSLTWRWSVRSELAARRKRRTYDGSRTDR